MIFMTNQTRFQNHISRKNRNFDAHCLKIAVLVLILMALSQQMVDFDEK